MKYLVRWEIDADADTPEQAAVQAWKAMRDPDSIANVFEVVSQHGSQQVDLEDPVAARLPDGTVTWGWDERLRAAGATELYAEDVS